MKSKTFHVKLLWLLFELLLEKIGILFNLASGYSADDYDDLLSYNYVR